MSGPTEQHAPLDNNPKRLAALADFVGAGVEFDPLHVAIYNARLADGKPVSVKKDGELFVPNESKVRYRGRFTNPTERGELIEDPAANDVAFMENSNTFHIHDGSSWSNTGSSDVPVVGSDLSVEPDVVKGSILDDWRFATPQNWVDAARFGVSEFNQDNNAALTAALDYASTHGLPVMARPSVIGYRVVGDITIAGGYVSLISLGSGALINFVDGGLRFDGRASTIRAQLAHNLENISVTRSGTVGPAILVLAADQLNIIRWQFKNVRVLKSVGHGIQFEGTYLCGIHGLWVFDCNMNGVHIDTGTASDSHFDLGVNSLEVNVGEIQNCAWGVYMSDARVVKFSTVGIEGNNDGGIWIHRDNRSVTFEQLYCENNAKQRPYDPAAPAQDESYTDIRIGDPDPDEVINRSIKINGGNISDGKVSHRRAIWVENGQQSIVVDGVIFHAYGGPAIRLVGPDIDDGAGGIIKGADNPAGDTNTTTIGHAAATHRTDGNGTVDGRLFANTARPLGFVDRTETDRYASIFTFDEYTPTVSLETPGNSVFNLTDYTARYHRHGQIVHFSVVLSFNAVIGTGSGQLLVGMPPVPSLAAVLFPVNVTNFSRFNAPGSTISMYGNVDNAISAIRLGWTRDGSTTTEVDEAHLTEGQLMRLELSGFYMTQTV